MLGQKKRTSAATMKDVAQTAGVSTATVSRTLMNPDKVSNTTREKVEQAVATTGYETHMLSRHLKRNDSRTILVVMPDTTDPFFAEIIKGVEDTANEQGYLVLLGNCSQPYLQEKKLLSLITSKHINGIVLLGSILPFDPTLSEQPSLPPMVMANEFTSGFKLPAVHIDNLTAAFNAINYLHQLGHRRIACISGPAHLPLSQYREQGYIQALRRNGIAIEPSYLTYGDFTFSTGASCLKELMCLPQPPSAVFCHSDIMAIGALSQCKKIGLRIPTDLSLIGFDNIEFSQYCDPPLTTIAQPCYQIGQQAMLLLLRQLEGQPVQRGALLLDSELLIRGSTAGPNANLKIWG